MAPTPPRVFEGRMEAFVVSMGVVALGKMGDNTQLLAVLLAVKIRRPMLIADVPAVFLGDKIAQKVSTTLVHGTAAAAFAVLGVLMLFNVGRLF